MFRGEEADEDARMVERVAREWSVPLVMEKINVPESLKDSGLSAQQGAREVRYCFFRKAAAGLGANRVVLAHHADDQAETVLINLLRGAGPAGLGGIPPIRDDFYIRPLLGIRRHQIEKYCQDFDIPFRTDRSNLTLKYLRNRVRLELIPFLEEKYNPSVVDTLNRMAEIVRDEDEYLESLAEKAYAGASLDRSGKITIALHKISDFPDVVKRRIIRIACRKLAGGDYTPGYDHIKRVQALIEGGPAGGRRELPDGIRIIRRYSTLEAFKHDVGQRIPFYRYELNIPGVTLIPEVGGVIAAELLDASQAGDPASFCGPEALLDGANLRGPVFVRQRMPGDVFSPLGTGGKMKLKKFFIDMKIPREEREAIPVVSNGDGDIIWVAGMRPGEPWKVTESTKVCLHLTFRCSKMLINRDKDPNAI